MTDKMLACFAAARRTGSFSTAAWELSMTQQAVSYSIKKLEEELGFPLFVRRASRVELTAGGEQLAAWYAALDSGAEALAGRFPPERLPAGSVTDSQIRCFLTAARLGSLSSAAEILYYSPQNLQGILSSLEKALGVTLFHRGRDSFGVTEAGASYWNLFEEAAASLRAVREYARKDHEARKATALIGLSEWLDLSVLEAALADFNGEWEFASMTNSQLLACLESGEADAALWSEGHAPVNRGFDMVPVAGEELCLFVPEGIEACPLLICPGWPRSFLENRAISTQELSFADGFRPTGVILTESFDELMERLAAGDCAVVGDRRFGRFAGLPGRRAIHLASDTQIVACRRGNASDDCAARLIEHLRAILGGDTKD